MSTLTLYIASDHRGLALKSFLIDRLKDRGVEIKDLGTHTDERCDAGDFAVKLASSFQDKPNQFGLLICGTGHAMAMTANRFKNIRAVQCTDVTSSRLARQHNDANVLVLGADMIGEGVAADCLDVFLVTNFLGGRYEERRKKLTALGGLS